LRVTCTGSSNMVTTKRSTLMRYVWDSWDSYLSLLTHSTSQNGWPSVTSPSVQPNSIFAVASVESEKVSQHVIYAFGSLNFWTGVLYYAR
jgi:hypothetical protein